MNLTYIQTISARKIVSVSKITERKFIRYKKGLLKAKDKSFHPNEIMIINQLERCRNQYK